MATNWKSGNEKSTNQDLTHQATDGTIYGAALTSWSRQQKLAMIASFAILGALLAATACSKQSPKPALIGVFSPVSSPASGSAMPAAAQAAEASSEATGFAIAPIAPARKTPKKRAANVTYSDVDSGVSFLYPRKAVLTSGDRAQPGLADAADTPMNFAQSGGVTVATVALPGGWFPGTDFASAFFHVNVNRNVSEQECARFAFVDTGNVDGEAVDMPKKLRSAPLRWRGLRVSSPAQSNKSKLSTTTTLKTEAATSMFCGWGRKALPPKAELLMSTETRFSLTWRRS
jgi:hypothetical protein